MMNKIPEINRARGYFLYTADGKRYLDMALDGGRLIMGHRHKGYGQALKNAIDKGILPSFPSPYAHRLKQAVRALFGAGCHVYLFKSEEHAKAALATKNLDYVLWRPLAPNTRCANSELNTRDPLNDPKNQKPSSNMETQKSSATPKSRLPLISDLPVIPVLPVPVAFAPGVMVSTTELNLTDEPVSPVILAGAVRALYNLKAFLADVDYSSWEKAGIAEACNGKWRVELPYLYPLCSKDKYPAVWDAFFEAGIILSANYYTPSVLPPDLSDGSRKKLLKLLAEC
ncbi:MAG: hypothetical protein IK040_06815 [Spirochaetia bacterium]|nr:hypothetical protein [Spirochaetia bacterium]MBR5016854.1 hypothetical protein [Spirochaetia bacterium]